nr:hypothetical protein [Aeromonas caviae]
MVIGMMLLADRHDVISHTQPWRMKEFCLYDPSGVLWRIAQNID